MWGGEGEGYLKKFLYNLLEVTNALNVEIELVECRRITRPLGTDVAPDEINQLAQ